MKKEEMESPEKIISWLQESLKSLDLVKGNNDFIKKIYSIPVCFPFHSISLENIKQIIGFEKEIRNTSFTGRNIAEQKLLDLLSMRIFDCVQVLQGMPILSNLKEIEHINASDDNYELYLIIRETTNFAFEIFQFKRPRDSFGGKRRAAAFEILTDVSRIIDLPEAIELATETLKKRGEKEIYSALEFIKQYHLYRKMALGKKLIDEIKSLAKRTKFRYVAVSALDVLVKTDVISEFGALNQLDEWKEKNDEYY